MNLQLRHCNLYFTKAGIYLLLFTIGLASSSHVTGSNMLLLLDFLLFAIIIFNFIYLKRLKSYSIELDIISQIEEDCGPPLEIKDKIILPLRGKLQLEWERFNKSITTEIDILKFSDKWYVKGDSMSLRGQYDLKQIFLEIEFPFPLFMLRGNFNTYSKLLVFPKDKCSKYLDTNHRNSMTINDRVFSHFRDYFTGDPISLISWKELARTNKLMTKVYESSTTSSQSYSISYDQDNEKEIFQKALSFFKFKINSGQPYRIISKHKTFVFNGRQANLNKLLIFLSIYEPPVNTCDSFIVLGELNVT